MKFSSQKELDFATNVLQSHNSSREGGEEMFIYGVVRSPTGTLYLCSSNGGSRISSMKYLEDHFRGEILYPFEKPYWWKNASFLWQRNDRSEPIPKYSDLV